MLPVKSISTFLFLLLMNVISVLGQEPEFITINNAPNAYEFEGNNRITLWADNHTGVLSLVHQSSITGHVDFDYSTNYGEDWTLNMLLGEGYCPQGGILNPSQTTNIDSIGIVAIFPLTDSDTSEYYRMVYHGLNESVEYTDTVLPIGFSKQNGFTITQNGKIFFVCQKLNPSPPYNYLDTLIVVKANFDNSVQQFDYEIEKLYAPVVNSPDTGIVDVKIEFSPDSEQGYIVALGNNNGIEFSEGAYYPIIYSSFDGGDSWQGPENLALGGPNGMEEVKEWLSDEKLEEFFGNPVPHRDSILYSTGFDIDITVDFSGSLHMIIVIGLSDGNYGIYTQPYFFSVFAII